MQNEPTLWLLYLYEKGELQMITSATSEKEVDAFAAMYSRVDVYRPGDVMDAPYKRCERKKQQPHRRNVPTVDAPYSWRRARKHLRGEHTRTIAVAPQHHQLSFDA